MFPKSSRNPVILAIFALAMTGLTAGGAAGCLSQARADAPPAVAPAAPTAQPTPPPRVDPAVIADARRLGEAFSQVAERVSPSVVSIQVERPRDARRMPFFFPGMPGMEGGDSPIERGMGS